MSRPLLFLDVDGVIALYPPPPDGVVVGEDDMMGVVVSAGVRARIARLLDAFEPVWATAWRGAAHPHFRAHLGLARESWPYVNYAGMKLPEIVRFAKGRRWAWVDDEVEYELRNLGDAWRDLPGSMTVQPDAGIGLNDEHVELLLEFAAASGDEDDRDAPSGGTVQR